MSNTHDLFAVGAQVERGVGRLEPERAKACKYGDPLCPCQDGDMCHYEGPNPMTPPTIDDIDTADHVHHAPSGEDWVVAYVAADRLAWCGWPQGQAALADCTLLKKATPGELDKLLREMADMDGNDMRAAYARGRLAARHEPPNVI